MAIAAALMGSAASVQTLSVEIVPAYVVGTRFGSGTCSTEVATAQVTGGAAPYTYSWTKVSGATFTIYAASAANTYFSINLGLNDEQTAVYRCTVTSADGQTDYADCYVAALELSYG